MSLNYFYYYFLQTSSPSPSPSDSPSPSPSPAAISLYLDPSISDFLANFIFFLSFHFIFILLCLGTSGIFHFTRR